MVFGSFLLVDFLIIVSVLCNLIKKCDWYLGM